MSKILISWEAYREDFETRIWRNEVKREKIVLHSGPTFSLHQNFYENYTKHILLNASTNDEDLLYSKLLVDELKSTFPKRNIEGVHIEIKDPLDISEIFKVSNDLLFEQRHESIEIYISPGAPNMRVAWLMAYPNFKQNVRLFQIRQARFSSNNKPEKVYVNIDDTFNPNAINIINEIVAKQTSAGQIFKSDGLKYIYNRAEQIAKTFNVGCLILGENGTGKENLANYIHENSSRSKKAFCAINCAAYSDDLLRSELFGHEKGSFTGADKQKIGIFEEANGGTIFLDEIGDISPKMQVSLLRVLQEKKIQRVGGVSDIPINVRVIAATNKNIEQLCEEENFRWDLYFRLAVTTLNLPPLRDWTKSEIKSLIEHFNNTYFHEFPNRKQKLNFSKEVLDHLASYHFKGNIRELQNLIISFYTFCEDEISLFDLPERIKSKDVNPSSRDEAERAHIKDVYASKKYNLKATAEVLGISRDTLRRKLIKYNLYKQSK